MLSIGDLTAAGKTLCNTAHKSALWLPGERGNAAGRAAPDLSRIDEIGFTDLSGGAGHGAEGNSAVDWIEVYGNAVKR